jgi:cell division initiation protein
MEVSPKTLREVEFREKMRGYHQEDVDQFLEQVAVAFEVLHDRLRQAVERAQRAESAASEAANAHDSGSDETLRRTLVLAQRTADLAVSEAREQAARLLAGAEQQAQGMLADAEDRARRSHEESVAEMRADLARLEAKRQQAQGEVELIRRWVEEQRNHLTSSLRDSLRALERASTTSAPPTSRPIDLPPARASEPRVLDSPSRSSGGAANRPDAGSPDSQDEGPDTVSWPAPQQTGEHGGHQGRSGRPAEPAASSEPRPAEQGSRRDPSPRPMAARTESLTDSRPDQSRAERGRPRQQNAPGDQESKHEEAKPPAAVVRAETADPGVRSEAQPGGRDRRTSGADGDAGAADGPDEQALDDFFDEERFADERRFGGRLRRRR